eukprot:1506484-Rhodomonas_salina.2
MALRPYCGTDFGCAGTRSYRQLEPARARDRHSSTGCSSPQRASSAASGTDLGYVLRTCCIEGYECVVLALGKCYENSALTLGMCYGQAYRLRRRARSRASYRTWYAPTVSATRAQAVPGTDAVYGCTVPGTNGYTPDGYTRVQY